MSAAGSSSVFVDVLVDANPNCEDGCALRFKAEDAPRVVRAIRWYDEADHAIDCDVVGWSSEGGGSPVAAKAVTIEDSSAGTAVLIWGGDWGVRLTPRAGGEAFGASEGHVRIAPDDVLE